MQGLEKLMLEKANALLQSGEVDRVIGWKKGESYYDVSPATFTKDNLEGFVYNCFCGANLSKYLVAESKKEGKMLVFLKPCDTYSFNQLLSEHRIEKEKFYVVGVGCNGHLDMNKVYAQGVEGILSMSEDENNLIVETVYGQKIVEKESALLIKCLTCKSKEFAVADETLVVGEMKPANPNRFEEVEKLESMTEAERYAFWKEQLSKCIRCNACRNACPACTCINCVFDNNASGISAKANADEFEEKLFHIIRAYHVAGRCTDCGECSRVCPQNIPLHLINRKVIKDINENYGDYQAGAEVNARNPLVNYTKADVEAKEVVEGGNK
ncbi:MAG: 4Fe-4S dicluster domain-containing protein [Clostridia bacterium]|nr:4Fe-4S dicluster domain-containing protein [Clostridia bacterium]